MRSERPTSSLKRTKPGVAAAFAPLLALGIGAATTGCDKGIIPMVSLSNQLPSVRITQAPIDTTIRCQPSSAQSCYIVTVDWIGVDPDGQVDHYEFAVDPPSGAGADTAWEATRSSQHRMVLTAQQPLPPVGFELPQARGFHVFVVRAVDNRGARGPHEARAFFSYTQAPVVVVVFPRPSDILIPTYAPSVRISWTGEDEDGILSRTPVKYKYTLLTASTPFTPASAADDPDSLRATYAPTFAGWDSVDGATTTVQYTNLTPDQEYMFVIVAIDEAGAYSPIFRVGTNMLRFRAGFAALVGPTISVSSEYFQYTWRPSYCPTCPSSEFFAEVPAGQAITIDWSATPPFGADLRGFRWALDIADVRDSTPRQSHDDLGHWSALSLNTTSVRLGPFAVGSPVVEEHVLYIEAQDNLNLRSLARLRLSVVPPNFRSGSILVVKDTRFSADNIDRLNPGCVEKPKGAWPTQAELDSFLFARGGVQWRCYPRDTLSRSGLFHGYDFDTIGTRKRQTDVSVRLSALAFHEHVIWIVDQRSAIIESTTPITSPSALRYMSGPGHFNSLIAYLKFGGKVWLVGGGGGFATTMPWNSLTNDRPTVKFSAPAGELVPGRFMYDHAGWRSEITTFSAGMVLRRHGGRHDLAPDPTLPYTSRLSELPRMEIRTLASDPRPPLRTNSEYNVTATSIEYLSKPNLVVEDMDPDPNRTLLVSTLDTLLEAAGGGLPQPNINPHNVVMTYAHGPRYPQGFVHSGFELWSFKRSQSRALVDFVLQRIWNLRPEVTTAPVHATREARGVRPPAASLVPASPTESRAPRGEPGLRPGIRRRAASTGVAPKAP